MSDKMLQIYLRHGVVVERDGNYYDIADGEDILVKVIKKDEDKKNV